MTTANRPEMWSAAYEGRLQKAWDATSLRALMFCPRYYDLTIRQGWSGSSIDLDFGILYHGALDVFDKAWLSGKSKADAQRDAVRWAIENSGHMEPYPEGGDEVWVPWGGRYATIWRCTGTEKYKNEKGNAAKCPLSHKGRWEETEAPSICGNCGSPIEVQNLWIPVRNDKDRYSLVRLVCWYCEEQPDSLAKGVAPYKFPDGTPAVELNFKVPLPWKTPEGEDYILCGYLDGLRTFGKEMFTGERKTTNKPLNQGYWAGFSPHVQVDTYDIVATAMFPDLPLKGVLIEGAQTLVGGAKFGFSIAYRGEDQREEYMEDLRWWLNMAESFAKANYWPMNRSNCWLCGFKGVCSKPPKSRADVLRANFEQRFWDPTQER